MRIPRGRTNQLAKSMGFVGAALLLISIAFMVSACGSTGDGIRVFSGDDFYDPLDPLPTGEPGDIIWMGTDGATQNMKVGDTVDVEITGIGTLSNPIVAEE